MDIQIFLFQYSLLNYFQRQNFIISINNQPLSTTERNDSFSPFLPMSNIEIKELITSLSNFQSNSIERPVISNCHRVTPIREQRPITDNTTVEDTYRPICEQPSCLERGKTVEKSAEREKESGVGSADRLFDNRPKIDPLYYSLIEDSKADIPLESD